MSRLNVQPNLNGFDEVYEELVGLTEGMDETESLRAQARLILILVNHLGDRETVLQAIRLARRSAAPSRQA
jgi:hypothetical protein